MIRSHARRRSPGVRSSTANVVVKVASSVGWRAVSRTDKTNPLRVQEQDARVWFRDNGGLWEGVKELRRRYNRRDRSRAKATLRRGTEPDPVQPRGRAKWDLW